MTKHKDHFDHFQPHTLLKHQILDAYIVAWAIKLLVNRPDRAHLGIVDAFAGAGRDEAGHSGSPVIAARKSLEAIAVVKERSPTADPAIELFAIERNRGRYRTLAEQLEPFRKQRPGHVHALPGELVDHIDEIATRMADAPTFYFLDPFGIEGLEASTYAKALRGPHNEIFALFSDMGAVRLYGSITSRRGDAADQVADILSNPSLFPEYDSDRIAAVEAEAERVQGWLDASNPASRKYLTRALGNDTWAAELADVPATERADKFITLFRQALRSAGATQVLSIPMRNDQGRRVYTLVHASKSPTAVVTMKEAISTGLNHPILSGAARDQMRGDLSVNAASFVNNLARILAGHTMPWAERDGLKWRLLAYTPLFTFQANEVKRVLRSAGILQRVDGREVCTFPP